MMSAARKRTVLGMLFTVAVFDMAGFVIAFVLFAPGIFQNTYGLLHPSVTPATRHLILGLLLGCYSLFQFFGAPLLGELSDRFGRRPILFTSNLGTCIAYCLSALALTYPSLALLFISRALAGLAAGNLTVAQAGIADLVDRRTLPRYMAAFSMAGSLGWMLGPYAASLLTDATIVPWFHVAIPFWTIALIFLFCFLVAWLVYKETEFDREDHHVGLGRSFHNVIEVFRHHAPVVYPFFCAVAMMASWMIYQSFLPTYLIERFSFTQHQEALAYSASAFWWFVSGILATTWFLKKYTPKQVILIPLFVAPLAVLCYLVIGRGELVWWLLAIANFSEGLVTACFYSILALMVDSHRLGRIFGAYNAGFALAGTVAPLLAGWLISYWINLPFTLSAIAMLVTGLFYLHWHRQDNSVSGNSSR